MYSMVVHTYMSCKLYYYITVQYDNGRLKQINFLKINITDYSVVFIFIYYKKQTFFIIFIFIFIFTIYLFICMYMCREGTNNNGCPNGYTGSIPWYVRL